VFLIFFASDDSVMQPKNRGIKMRATILILLFIISFVAHAEYYPAPDYHVYGKAFSAAANAKTSVNKISPPMTRPVQRKMFFGDLPIC